MLSLQRPSAIVALPAALTPLKIFHNLANVSQRAFRAYSLELQGLIAGSAPTIARYSVPTRCIPDTLCRDLRIYACAQHVTRPVSAVSATGHPVPMQFCLARISMNLLKPLDCDVTPT